MKYILNIPVCSSKPHYFKVNIQNTTKEMRKVITEFEGPYLKLANRLYDNFNDCDAAIFPFRTEGDYCIGNIYFSLEKLSIKTISHEFLHAALWFSRIEDENFSLGEELDANEELVALRMHTLVNNFLRTLVENGIPFSLVATS